MGLYKIKRHRTDSLKILSVKLTASNAAIYGELGRFPLYVNRYVRIIKYWLKLLCSNNCIMKVLYMVALHDLEANKHNWLFDVKNLLYTYGFGDIWENASHVNAKLFLNEFHQRLKDCFIQNWNSNLQTNSVLTVYKELKNDFEYETYLNADIPSYYLKLFTQLRISCHKLRVETGRYGRNRLERHERRCEVCHSLDIEDEYHFVCICEKYKTLRKRYLPMHVVQRPSMFKFIELMKCKNSDVLIKMITFIRCAIKIRDNVLNVNTG